MKIDAENFKTDSNMESEVLFSFVNLLVNLDINIVFSSSSIGDLASQYLEQKGIIAFGNVPFSTITSLAKTLRTRVVPENLEYTKPEHLQQWKNAISEIEEYSEQQAGVDKMSGKILVLKTMNCVCMSLIVKGPSQIITEEAMRSIEDAVKSLRSAMTSGLILGAGATEAALAARLMRKASTCGGGVRVIMEKFAQGLMNVPRVLLQNAGHEAVGPMVWELEKRHRVALEKGVKW
jgi:chaperonin GroEL (HSP60 family)